MLKRWYVEVHDSRGPDGSWFVAWADATGRVKRRFWTREGAVHAAEHLVRCAAERGITYYWRVQDVTAPTGEHWTLADALRRQRDENR